MSVGLTAAEISAAPDPLYVQVYGAIADAIQSGRLQPGDRLPTDRTFAKQLGVSRATVRRALRQLADEGLVEATVGRGSFVCAGSIAEPANVLMSFTELAAARGLTASARVLSESVRPAVLEEASVFGIGLQELVFELRRLRMLDSRPVAIDRIRVPLTVAPALVDQDFTDASIYATLEAAGAAPVRADMVASATTADDSCAATLGVEDGAPLLVCTTMSFDDAARLVEIGEITYRADRYQLHVMLARPNERRTVKDGST